MLCRLFVTCALLGHVVLSLPAARAPRYTPLPDEVDSDETRRVLGSSVVTSVSVIMDLGNGSQALFSESSNNHREENKDNPANTISSVESHMSPEKRPVGSPPALLSPDRYEFYTFDESGELVRRLMTLEQIQSLIAGGDDANRIGAISIPVEIDTVPSPLATDPQGQVVASVQQVLAEELLASTKKNGTEPHEVEVEAEVQENLPSSEPEQVEENTPVKVSTEAGEEGMSPTTQMPSEISPTVIPSTSEMVKEEEKPAEEVPSETEPLQETYSEKQTTTRPAEVEMSTSAVMSEEKIPEEITEINVVQGGQSVIEVATKVTSMVDEVEEDLTPQKITTEKQEEVQEHLTSPPFPIASESIMASESDVKDTSPTEATVEDIMGTMDSSDAVGKPEMDVPEGEKLPEVDMDTVKEDEALTAPPTEMNNETERPEVGGIEEQDHLPAEGEKEPVDTETIENKPQEEELLVPLMGEKPEDESEMQTPIEPSSEIKPSEMTDGMDDEVAPTNQAYTPSTEVESDIKDVVEEVMPTGIVEEIPSPIPVDSQILEEADLSGITDDLSPSKPMEIPHEGGQMEAEKNPVVLEMESANPEAPASVVIPETSASVTEIPTVIPASAVQEISTTKPSQATGSGGDKEEAQESEEEDDGLLDQLVASVTSVLSQVTGDDDEDYEDDFRKKPLSTAAPTQPTEQIPEEATTSEMPATGIENDENKQEEETPYTESIIPDMRDPTKDHTVPSVQTEKFSDFEVEKEETTKPAVSLDEKDSVTEENFKGEESMPETSAAEETTTIVGERIQDNIAPLTTTDSNQEMAMTTEKAEMPSSASSTEIPMKDNEDNAGTEEYEQEKESITTNMANQQEVDTPVTEIMSEDDEKSESLPVTESTTDNSPVAEEEFDSTDKPELAEEVKETMNEESITGEQPNDMTTMVPQMAEEAMKEEEEKVEGMKEDEKKEGEVNEEKKEEEIKGEQQTEDNNKKNEPSTEHFEEESTTITNAHSTEKFEMAEEVQTTMLPVDEKHDLKAPNDHPEDEGLGAVKGVQSDLLLIENLHKEAALNREPLLPGNDPTEDIPTHTEEPTTMSQPMDTSSQGNVYHDDVGNLEVITSFPPEGIKPSDLAEAVEEETMETEAPTTDTKIEEESIKPTTVSDLEHPIDASDKDTSQNPWTKIPIPLVHPTSTTPESEKYPSPSTSSTTDTDDLLSSSPAPDDLPEPNGLLPLLTEKPSQSTTFAPSTTNKPATERPSNTEGSSVGQQVSTPGGTIVPPLMSAFPPAPNGNSGLESTSASTDPDVKRFVDLCNDLAFSLYGQVTAGAAASSVPATRGANGGGVQTRSLVMSPFALNSLLAMVFLGARGPTAEEMNELLRLDDMVTFNPHQVLFNVTESVITSPGVSAAAFVRELYSDKANGKLLDFYKARANAFYNGHVEEVDFKEVNDVLRRRTNHLVRWQTRGRVPEYLRGSSLKLRSPLAALSANFFEADCQRASSTGTDGEMYFEVPATGRRRRRLVPVPAVVWRGVFLAGYDPGLDATVLELRHGGGEVSTVLVLPGRHGQSIESADISGGLTRLETWLVKGGKDSWSSLLRSALPRGPMEVQLPRFAHRSVLNATGALSRMGLQHLFQDGKADLGGLNGGLGGKLHLADIIQMTAFGVCADDGSSKRHLETYPSAQRTGRKHRRSLPDTSSEERPNSPRGARTAWVDELAREEENSYVFAAAAAARELPLAVRPRQARIPRPALKQQSRVVLPRLRFDRPFLYFVRHNPSGFILLMGRFNPRLFP